MNPIVYAIPVFMLTIFFEAWLARRQGKAVYDIPDAITSLQHGTLSQVTGLFQRVATLGIYVAVYETYRATELPTDNLWIWAFALIAYDFLYYWNHRMGHEVNVLWASHVVHHSSEYYNLSTALRQTSTGGLLGWLFYLPMAVAGVSPTMFVTVALIDLLYQYWVHTELVGRLGWVDRVLVTPSNHRVHHGQNDYCIDKNYGGILILWDRLFGTFADERDGEKIIYGIRRPLRSFNPVWGNLHYYADLWNESRVAQGWRAKLGVWLAPPGGWSDEPIAHFDAKKFERYDAHTSRGLRRYAAVQYAVASVLVTHLIGVSGQLELLERLAYALCILATALTLGALMEGRRLAIRLEQLRVIAIGLAFATLPTWFGFAAPTLLRVVALVGAVICLVWLARQVATDVSKTSPSGTTK